MEEGGGMAGGREVVRAVGRLRGRVGVGSGGGRRPFRGVGTAKPAHTINYTNTRATTLEVSRAYLRVLTCTL